MTAPVVATEKLEGIDSAADDAFKAFLADMEAEAAPTGDAKEPAAPTTGTGAAEKPAGDKPAAEKKPDEKPAGEFGNVPTITADLATDFVIRDADGAEMEVPGLVIEYKANGKTRKERLDHVVKMAQHGVYSHERELAVAKKSEEALAKASEVEEVLRTREEQLESLLADPELYESVRQRYEEANSPEKREARLRQELDNQRNEVAKTKHAAAATQFFSEELMPALDTISAALPEVSAEELQSKMGMEMYKYMENGVVPPSRYNAIRSYIINELTPWAKSLHTARKTRFEDANKKAALDVEKAKVEAQNSKNLVARVIRPATRPVRTKAVSAGAHATDSVEGATDAALKEAMSGLSLG